MQDWYVRGPGGGRDWHIEGPGVDEMLCGVRIALDDGEVKVKPGKNTCQDCLADRERSRRRR